MSSYLESQYPSLYSNVSDFLNKRMETIYSKYWTEIRTFKFSILCVCKSQWILLQFYLWNEKLETEEREREREKTFKWNTWPPKIGNWCFYLLMGCEEWIPSFACILQSYSDRKKKISSRSLLLPTADCTAVVFAGSKNFYIRPYVYVRLDIHHT